MNQGRIAVYTCITGGYDRLRQPLATDGEFDFICFVEKGTPHPGCDGVWTFREMESGCGGDALMTSRWPKLNPHLALPDYEWSLWMDGNVQIADGEIYDIVREKIAAGVVYSGISHPLRDCVYEEAGRCLTSGRIGIFDYLRTVLFLALRRFPRHFGLMENNVILRRHGAPAVIEMDTLWWKRLQKGPRRDQLSFMWCLREAGVRQDTLLPKGYSTRNHSAFEYTSHAR